MSKISRLDAFPIIPLLQLLIKTAQAKCSYINTPELISKISTNPKFLEMRYKRSFEREMNLKIESYNLSKNLFFDITDIFPRESNKHFTLAGLCVFMMLYNNLTEIETPSESQKVYKEIKSEIKYLISTPYYGNEAIAKYLLHHYVCDFEQNKLVEISKFIHSLSIKLHSKHLISLDKRQYIYEVFENCIRKKIDVIEDSHFQKIDMTRFEEDESRFVSFVTMLILMPILLDNNSDGLKIALDLMTNSFLSRSSIVTETLDYNIILG